MVGPPPLTGLKVLELAGLAPGPFAGLLLADSGASVLRVDRATTSPEPTTDQLARRKSSIAVDLKNPAGIALARELARNADILIEPFRPGVMEKLGLGPEVLCKDNTRLIYARMTGFRRDGKYRDMAGHDINYLAVAGVLGLLGRKGQKPTPPINILGDFAGGGAVLFQGILLALLAREKTGKGQVVEANMVDGSGYLASFPRFALKTPMGNQPRGQNMLDSGCPFYDTYETRDGGYMAVGALEPQFYHALVEGLGLGNQGWDEKRYDRESWDEMRDVFVRTFKRKTRDEWETIFDGTDACCTPVFGYGELEGSADKGDQRPIVTLKDTPFLAVDGGSSTIGSSRGQGPGVPGGGYVGVAISPGQDGDATLQSWLGWKKGTQFDEQKGGLILKSKYKL